MRRPPLYDFTTLRRLGRYLESRDGVDAHTFIDHEGLPDLVGARAFAEELRRQAAPFLDRVLSIEQSGCRVLLILRDGWRAFTPRH